MKRIRCDIIPQCTQPLKNYWLAFKVSVQAIENVVQQQRLSTGLYLEPTCRRESLSKKLLSNIDAISVM